MSLSPLKSLWRSWPTLNNDFLTQVGHNLASERPSTRAVEDNFSASTRTSNINHIILPLIGIINIILKLGVSCQFSKLQK